MGIYLNSKKPFILYKKEYDSTYFVDKTRMLEDLIPLVEESNRNICLTRPRRFGKTVMASMIASFFGKGKDAQTIFDNLHISANVGYKKHTCKIEILRNALGEPEKRYLKY